MSSRHICRFWNIQPHQQRCAKKIYNPKPHTIYKQIFAMYILKFPHHFPFWRRYTFLSHLTTKSKISIRWIKKPVAVTDGVYIFIHKLLPEHSHNYFAYAILCVNVRVVAGRHTLWREEQRCPPAHFCVYGICIITNNGVLIKYKTQKPHSNFYINHHFVFS